MKKQWKPVKDYEDYYLISNYGELYIKKKKRLVKECKDKQGYTKIILYKDGTRKYTQMHRLVAQHFIPNPDNKPLILHKIPLSKGGTNRADNLYWGTPRENIIDKIKDGNFYSYLHKRKIKYKPVNQYDLQHNFIKKWSSVHQIADELNISRRSIYRNLSGERQSYKGYIFEYADKC